MEPTQTAVIVPVAAAEPVVADHRRRLDRSSAWGVPAHVTVLFPFVPPADVDDRVVGRLRDVCATVPAFDDVVPHLTVGESESVDELRAAELDVSGHLPFVARVEHALLIAGTDQPDSWRTVAELPLGTSIGRLLGA